MYVELYGLGEYFQIYRNSCVKGHPDDSAQEVLGNAKLEKSSTWNNPKGRGSVEFLLLRATVDQENLPRAVL